MVSCSKKILIYLPRAVSNVESFDSALFISKGGVTNSKPIKLWNPSIVFEKYDKVHIYFQLTRDCIRILLVQESTS